MDEIPCVYGVYYTVIALATSRSVIFTGFLRLYLRSGGRMSWEEWAFQRRTSSHDDFICTSHSTRDGLTIHYHALTLSKQEPKFVLLTPRTQC